MHNRLRYFAGPLKVAARARVPGLPIPMHDRLQYGGERRHADAGRNQNGMLRPEYVAGRRSIWSININLHNVPCMRGDGAR